jgi:hypothetical protein
VVFSPEISRRYLPPQVVRFARRVPQLRTGAAARGIGRDRKVHDLPLVTRNVAALHRLGVKLLDPFSA